MIDTQIPNSLLDVPALARCVLILTRCREQRRKFPAERKGAKAILRVSRRLGYFHTEDAAWDHDWLTDVLGSLIDAGEEE
jgi:hypothetical protein